MRNAISKYHFYLKCASFFFAISISSSVSQAQDLSFSQFYANKIYLNPAFAGSIKNKKVGFSYRDQWVGVSEAFRSFAFSYSAKLKNSNNGFGLSFLNDRAGSGAYTNQQLSGAYAHNFKISHIENLRFGMGFSFNQLSIDPSKFLFADQVVSGASISQDNIASSTNYINTRFGALFTRYKNWWLGFSLNNLNEPRNSLFQNSTVLKRRYSVHAGKTILLGNFRDNQNSDKFTYAIHYQSQAGWDALDLGAYLKSGIITYGLWYKGIPLLKSNDADYINHDALVLLLGFEFEKFQFGYSRDLTISKLKRTGGTHEISVSIEFGQTNLKRKPSIMPCPKF